MLSKQEKEAIVINFGTKFGKGEKDTGSTAVQIALISARIKSLSLHLSTNKHDYHSQRGLMVLIGQRRRYLRYLERTDRIQYKNLIQDLGLRK